VRRLALLGDASERSAAQCGIKNRNTVGQQEAQPATDIQQKLK